RCQYQMATDAEGKVALRPDRTGCRKVNPARRVGRNACNPHPHASPGSGEGGSAFRFESARGFVRTGANDGSRGPSNLCKSCLDSPKTAMKALNFAALKRFTTVIPFVRH